MSRRSVETEVSTPLIRATASPLSAFGNSSFSGGAVVVDALTTVVVVIFPFVVGTELTEVWPRLFEEAVEVGDDAEVGDVCGGVAVLPPGDCAGDVVTGGAMLELDELDELDDELEEDELVVVVS